MWNLFQLELWVASSRLNAIILCRPLYSHSGSLGLLGFFALIPVQINASHDIANDIYCMHFCVFCKTKLQHPLTPDNKVIQKLSRCFVGAQVKKGRNGFHCKIVVNWTQRVPRLEFYRSCVSGDTAKVVMMSTLTTSYHARRWWRRYG